MDFLIHLPESVLKFLRRQLRKLSVRVALMGILAFVTLAITPLIEALLPADLTMRHGGASSDRLLNLIASAMLAVTTFSLTVMVSVYRSSSSQWTPRVHQLIMQDRITQNTLAAFIGAFVFALVAIILRELRVFGDGETFVLFWMTVLVLGFVVWSLIRWTLHLQTLGSLIETTRQVEEITARQFRERLQRPCLGAVPWDGKPPTSSMQVTAHRSGYVQEIYPAALQNLARLQGIELYLEHGPGDFVFHRQPLVRVRGRPDDQVALENGIAQFIRLDEVRIYEQDPRFGLLVLSEIGSRALSPGINDPGTAIDVLNRATRILSFYSSERDSDTAPLHDRLHVRPMDPRDLIADAFDAISRDGAANVEVMQRLQRCIGGLMQHTDPELCRAARDKGRAYLDRALAALDWPADREALREKAAPGVLRDDT